MIDDAIAELTDLVKESIVNNQFIKIVLSERRDSESDLNSVKATLILIKGMIRMKLEFKYKTREETRHYEPIEGGKVIFGLLKQEFRQVNLFTTREQRHVLIKKGDKVMVKRMTYGFDKIIPKTGIHDKIKKRFVSVHDNVYLNELGVTNPDGSIKKSREDKFRQIDRYIGILDGIIRSAELPKKICVTDMGCGKGYLTFALYDFLHNNLKMDVDMTGVEFRQELVDATNVIAHKAGFEKLRFVTGNIYEVEIDRTDMLIALHACDTATDDSIYRGIQQNAKVIICAPCCHKQIRKQLEPQNVLKNITKYGILAERQAEMITDTIRAMIMEAYGYKTNVFEFISGEHTPKNLLIVGIKKKYLTEPDQSILKEIAEIKKVFNIRFHYLEQLLHLSL